MKLCRTSPESVELDLEFRVKIDAHHIAILTPQDDRSVAGQGYCHISIHSGVFDYQVSEDAEIATLKCWDGVRRWMRHVRPFESEDVVRSAPKSQDHQDALAWRSTVCLDSSGTLRSTQKAGFIDYNDVLRVDAFKTLTNSLIRAVTELHIVCPDGRARPFRNRQPSIPHPMPSALPPFPNLH